MKPVSRSLDRVEAIFDDETLVADAGLIVPATLMVRLGLELLVDATVQLVDRVGRARPGSRHRPGADRTARLPAESSMCGSRYR